MVNDDRYSLPGIFVLAKEASLPEPKMKELAGRARLTVVLERRQDDQAARAELALSEAAKFFLINAAMATWMAQADQGQRGWQARMGDD